MRRAMAVLAGAAAFAALSACDAPFNLGQPSTRALENGAADSLSAAKSFELSGSYSESGDHWSIELQFARPVSEHITVSKSDVKLEAIIVGGNDAFFRGNQFLSQHMGSDTVSRNLVKAAGNAWWRGSADQVPRLPDLTDGISFRATFLGTAVSQRIDHVAVGGVEAVNLSGPRADVFVAAIPPYRLLRVHLKKDVVIDGIVEADFRYGKFDQDFQIAVPKDVIDFSNLSTLPPIYTVLSVSSAQCGSLCVVSAKLKNLGGTRAATGPSTITFTLTNSVSGKSIGSCHVQVAPNVGYNATTTVSCPITFESGLQVSAAVVTAKADNPGAG
jgi:hypothetical protein